MALEIFFIHSRVCSGGLFFNKTISQAKFFLNSCLVSHSIPKSLLSKRGNEEGFALFCCEKWKKLSTPRATSILDSWADKYQLQILLIISGKKTLWFSISLPLIANTSIALKPNWLMYV